MQEYKQALTFGKTNKDVNSNNEKVVLELDWLALRETNFIGVNG